MPGTELFGSPLGDKAFLEDQHTAGLTRLQNAQAGEAELKLQQERQFMQLMRMASTGAPPLGLNQDEQDPYGDFSSSETGVAPKLDRLAQLATQSGLVTKGASLAKDAALIEERHNAAAASRALLGVRRLRQQKDEAELVGRTLDGVNDQDSYDRAMAVYQMTTGKMSKYAGLPYTPELVQRLQAQAISVKDQAALDIRDAEQRSHDSYRKSRLQQIDNQQAINAAARGVARDREGNMVKVGGGKPLTISQAERDDASMLITRDYPDLADPSRNADRRTAATLVASGAKTLMQRNQALTWGEALSQAYTAERSSFKTDTGLFGGKTTKFEGGGKTPQTAIPKPKSAKDAKPGLYYYDAQGNIGKWTGKGFEVAGKREAPTTDDSDLTDEPEEE